MIRRISLATLLATVSVSQSVTIPSAYAQDHLHRRRGMVLGGLAGAALGVAIGDKGNNETAGALIGGAVGAIAGGAIGDANDQRIQHDRQYHSGYPLQRPAYGGAHHQPPHYNSPYPNSPYPSAPYPNAPYPSGPHSHHPAPYRSHSPYTAYQPGYYDTHTFAPSPYTEEVIVGSQANPYSVTVTDPYRQSMPSTVNTNQPLSNQDVVALVRSGLSDSLIVRQINARGITRPLPVSEIIALHQQGVSETIIEAMQGVSDQAPAPIQRANRVSAESADRYGSSVLQDPNAVPEASDGDWDDQGPTLTAPAFTGPRN